MRLRKPCIHDCYDRHWPNLFEAVVCPGGEFLPEDAANRMHSVIRVYFPDLNDYAVQLFAEELFRALAPDQVGEPG